MTIATSTVLAVGVALRMVAYARRSVLWLDEAATARNIVERSLSDLLTVPLDFGQAAPKGFLLLEWLVTRVFGTSDLAFRFVPFACGIASLFLFHAIARRLLPPPGALAALLFFAVGYWFILYSSDVHPYTMDLALSLAALLLALEVRQSGYPARGVWALAGFGAVAAWFSNGVVLTLFGLGASLGVLALKERGLAGAVRTLAPLAVVWGVSAALSVWVATHSFFPRDRTFFYAVWRDGMVPVLRSPAAFGWLWREWRGELAFLHGWNVGDPAWTSLYPALALTGFVSLLRRRTADALVVASVVAAYVLVSMANQYPYDARFVLAPMAAFVLGIGESLGALALASWGRATAVARALAVLLCVPPVYRVFAYPPPYQWTVTGSYLAEIRDRWQPGDIIYSTYGRSLELLYHAPRFGFRPSDYIVGPCDFDDPRAALRAADALRGRRRAWVIVGTGYYFPQSLEYSYLRTIGVRRDSLPVNLPGSIRQGPVEPFDIGTAYLFDLSDATRLARTTAETYAISPMLRRAVGAVDEWSCYGVRAPLVKQSELRGTRD